MKAVKYTYPCLAFLFLSVQGFAAESMSKLRKGDIVKLKEGEDVGKIEEITPVGDKAYMSILWKKSQLVTRYPSDALELVSDLRVGDILLVPKVSLWEVTKPGYWGGELYLYNSPMGQDECLKIERMDWGTVTQVNHYAKGEKFPSSDRYQWRHHLNIDFQKTPYEKRRVRSMGAIATGAKVLHSHMGSDPESYLPWPFTPKIALFDGPYVVKHIFANGKAQVWKSGAGYRVVKVENLVAAVQADGSFEPGGGFKYKGNYFHLYDVFANNYAHIANEKDEKIVPMSELEQPLESNEGFTKGARVQAHDTVWEPNSFSGTVVEVYADSVLIDWGSNEVVSYDLSTIHDVRRILHVEKAVIKVQN